MKKLLILAGIVISSASFGHAKLTDLGGSGGGTGGGATGAQGPAGPAGSAVYGQTTVGGASTTITNLAVVSPSGVQVVGISGSSMTVDLSTFSQTAATETFTGGKTLQVPTTFQVSLQYPHIRVISMNAFPFPIAIGHSAAGSDAAYAWSNTGAFSTHAYISDNKNTGIMSFNTRGKQMMTIDPGTETAIGIGTSAPTAALHISSGAGSGSVFLLRVSTGPFDIFKVMGDSIVCNVPLYLPDGSKAGSGGTTPDNGFGLAQSTINSKLDNLIAGASFYIQNSTSQTSGVFHISSGTFEGTATIKGGLIVGGNGPAGIYPSGGSVVNVFGDLAFPTTWYTGVSFPFDAGSSSRVVSGSLYGQNGRFLGDGQQSSGPAVCGYFQKWIPQNYLAGSTPTFTDLVELSTGLISQQTQWLLDFATSSVVAVSTGLAYSSQIAVTVTGTTSGSGGIRMQTTDQTIPGLTNILGSGEKFLIVRARRDGANALAADPAQSDTAIGHIGFAIKMQQ